MVLTKSELEQILSRIKELARPKLMYLFGSYAWGTPNENSDIDVLVVKDKIVDRFEELIRISLPIMSADFSVDILLYSDEDYKKRKAEGWSIFEEIEKKGRLIHAA